MDSLMAQSQTYYVAEQVTRSFLEDDSVVTMRKVLFPSIVFVHCTSSFVESAKKCSENLQKRNLTKCFLSVKV